MKTTSQNYRADSIQEYHLTEQLIHGDFRDDPKNYDLISIVILNLGQNQTSHRLLNLLYLAFVDIKSSDEKENILRDEYDIELTRDMKEELKKMSGLMEPAVKFAAERAAKEAAKKAKAEAAAETKKQTLLESIRNLMETLNLTAQKAMDALKIPADKQKEYLALI